MLGSPGANSFSSRPFTEAVYFNSVDFNGNQFLSDEALDAGYKRERAMPAKTTVVTSGIASLVQQDYVHAATVLEDAILRTLVKSSEARRTARELLESRPSLCGDTMVWSHPQKRWLFETLVFKESALELSGSLSDTRSFLVRQEDAPAESFDTLQNVSDSTAALNDTIADRNKGILEQYFSETLPVSNDGLFSEIDENLPNLHIQEVLGQFLWISAFRRVEKIRDEFQKSPLYLPAESTDENVTARILMSNDTLLGNDQAVSCTQAINLCGNETQHSISLAAGELRDAINSAKAMKQSSVRITSNVMDESLSTGIGQLSMSKRRKLVVEVDQHVKNVTLSKGYVGQFGDERSMLSDLVNVEEDDECFEESLEQMAEEWGDWLDEDYVWSSSHTEESTTKAMAAFRDSAFPGPEEVFEEVDDEESLEDFNARIALEYNDWEEAS